MIPEGERPIEKVIGENIERYFLESEFTNMTEFLKSVAYSNVQLKKLKNGETSITTSKLQHIAAKLGVKTIDLIEDWAE